MRVGVNDLHQARAVLAWAAFGHHAVELHALDVPLMGVGFWRAVEQALDRPLVVECGSHAGTALAALRAGLRCLRSEIQGPQAASLAGLVHAHGAQLVAAAPDVCLPPGAPPGPTLARYRLGQVTAARPPVTHRAETHSEQSTTGRVQCD